MAPPDAAAIEPEFRNLPVHLLVEPSNPSRQTFDEEKLRELIQSIRELGVIEPLCVEPKGQLYQVHAGHRRLIAARALGLERVPCRIYPPGALSGEALKHHENKMREDVNAAEMGSYFWRLLETECGGDVDELCRRVHEQRQYVEGRLALARGDERVLIALREGKISFGVAQQLNWVKDGATRQMYLIAAMEGGATVAMVRHWRQRGETMDALVVTPAVIESVSEAPAPAPQVDHGPECYICHTSEDQHEMAILYVHRSCARAVERFQASAAPAPVITEGV